LWNRDFPGAFAALNQNWSDGVQNIMFAVKGKQPQFEVHLALVLFNSVHLQKKLESGISTWSVKPTHQLAFKNSRVTWAFPNSKLERLLVNSQVGVLTLKTRSFALPGLQSLRLKLSLLSNSFSC